MSWLSEYANAAGQTDQLRSSEEHLQLLASGLIGEAGSILSELKKLRREQVPFAARRDQVREEIGDFLWYYVRLLATLSPDLLPELGSPPAALRRNKIRPGIEPFLEFGVAASSVLDAIRTLDSGNLRSAFQSTWTSLLAVSRESGISLREAAEFNRRKIESRWPLERHYIQLFDAGFPDDEQLPRRLDIEFKSSVKGDRQTVGLRCNGINIGDRLTDNIRDPDGYRYHDIFHFAHMVHLGWSPILRGIFHCKRKSVPRIDEAEDGARAGIIEEAVSVLVFSQAKRLDFFERSLRVDYELLKTIKGLIAGYEVEKVPMWQWEAAILDGYRLFRELRDNGGGRIQLDLEARSLLYARPLNSNLAVAEEG